jgi:hypothetical protein
VSVDMTTGYRRGTACGLRAVDEGNGREGDDSGSKDQLWTRGARWLTGTM